MVRELFAENNENFPLPLKDSEVYFYPCFLQRKEADIYFEQIRKNSPWQQDSIKIFGKVHRQPRLTALFANNAKSYSYSGLTMSSHPFQDELEKIKNRIKQNLNLDFTTCLANYYRTGKDSMGWHADDEKELGRDPVIASVSLGEQRMFHLKHKKDSNLRFKINLSHGSLLLMMGTTQHHWLHSIPKTSRPIGPRINLTFRKI